VTPTPAALLVRVARLDGPDAATVSALVEAYLVQTEREKELHLGGTGDSAALPARYRAEVDDVARAYENATVYLAELGDVATGVAVVQPRAGAREVKRVWVDPAARGRGVGSVLLEAALGGREVPTRLSVWDWRDDAIRLYRRHGFAHVPSWERRERLLCMEAAAS
jgi:GNAT superfamily N-acetyltransferase